MAMLKCADKISLYQLFLRETKEKERVVKNVKLHEHRRKQNVSMSREPAIMLYILYTQKNYRNNEQSLQSTNIS